MSFRFHPSKTSLVTAAHPVCRFASNDSSAYNYLPDSVGEFPCYEQLTERMVNAGLAKANYYPLTFGIATLYVGEKAAA